MVAVDEAALICDLAETYNIYDYKALPPTMAALFACGLRDNSRIKRKLSGLGHSDEILLMSLILDRVTTLMWLQTEDGHKGRNRPESLYQKLTQNDNDQDVVGYSSGEDFAAAFERITKGGAL